MSCQDSIPDDNGFMTRFSDPRPGPPVPAATEASRDGESSEMTGRMLQVSRFATLGEMAAGVAHELNQPLTAIANYAQACDRLLSRPQPDLDDLRTAMREIAAQAVRAGEILRRLRGLAQSQPVRRERADLNATIEAIRDIILADGRVDHAQVRFDLATRLPAVSIDTAQIQHVILNLVRNGLEAPAVPGVAGRELLLRTRLTSRGDVEIAVLDNGPGLAPQAIERMFDPFFSTKPEGTGLGLAISRTVVRAHGGVLTHHPNIPHGAAFSIRLPAEAIAPELTEAPAASACILLVDDHTGVRDATAMVLRGEGFEVQCAASLAEARAALREHPQVDLVIADYHLQKGETGLQVIAAARQVAGEQLPAVLVSGDISATLCGVEAGERLRVAAKPIRSNKLMSLIRELLSAGKS
jgi:nitrogen-specific signal transduction histidine kinase/CheY-like chemotaxis protein